MIDEKKIEEAAHDYVGMICENEKYKIFWLVFRAFKFAIDWFLGNLWHDASEEPKRDKYLLLEYDSKKLSDKNIIPYGYEYLNTNLTKDYWKYIVKIEHITRWLYIEDLMKGGK